MIAVAFFPRLFLGEVLSGGSNTFDQPPFASQPPKDFKSYSNEVGGDVWRQHRAFQHYQRRSFREGRFPHWNPHVFLGAPFHANGQSSLLHPWNAVYWLFDPDAVRGPLAILRLWTGAAATYLLLRRWNIIAVAAFAGGAAWMFAQFNVRWLLWPLSYSSLWLPVLAWTLDRLIERPSLHRLAHAGLAATVLQLSGHPETQFQAGVAAGVFVLIRLAAGVGLLPSPLVGDGLGVRGALSIDRSSHTSPGRRWLSGILLALAAMVLGTLGSAVQTLPFLHQLSSSVDWVEHSRGPGHYLPVEGLKMTLVPDAFGRPRAMHGYDGPSNYIESACGFGVIALAAAVAALLAAMLHGKPNDPFARAGLGFGLAAGLFGCLAFGDPWLAPLITKLPLFDQLNPRRWVFAFAFFGVLLAALGPHSAIGDRRARRLFLLCLAVVLGASGWITIQSDRASPARLQDLFAEPSCRVIEQHPALHAALGWSCTLAAFLAVVLVRNRGMSMAAGLVALQGFLAGWDFSGTAPRSMIDPPEPPLLTTAKALVGDGRLIGTEEVLSPNLGMLYGFRDVRGYDFPLDYRLAQVFKRLGWGWNGMTFVPRKSLLSEASPETAAFLNRSAVRAVFSNLRLPEINVGGQSWRQVAEGPIADALFISSKPAPRVKVARRAVTGTADEAFVALFQPVETSPVVIEGLSPDDRLQWSATGTTTVVRDDPERVEIEADLSDEGILVLSDRMSLGWSATVDGVAQYPLTADYLFRAAVVHAGKHRIVWTYSAPGFQLGLWISGCVVALLAAASFLKR
jgi:hypothetical protein